MLYTFKKKYDWVRFKLKKRASLRCIHCFSAETEISAGLSEKNQPKKIKKNQKIIKITDTLMYK